MPDEDDEECTRQAEEGGELAGRNAFETFRLQQPEVKAYTRGKSCRIEEAAGDAESFSRAMETFNNDKYAASNRAAIDESRRKWWAQKAALVDVAPYPLTMENIEILGTMLKLGECRSCALYFSAAKQEHVERGYNWSDQLEQGVKSALTSCLRGIRPRP